jgi:uroporphyrinogen decarboxylase
MSYRQTVIDAIEKKQTPLTPWAFELTGEFEENYKKQFPCDSVEEHLQSHIMFGKYKNIKFLSDTLYEDAFGVQWQLGDDGGYIGTPVNKLVNEDNVEAYVFPQIDEPSINKAINEMREDKEHFRMFRLTYSLYERVWSLMGLEDTLLGMAMEEDYVTRIFERVTEYQLKLLERVLDEEFEGVLFGDDWGGQKGLLMGPVCFRKFIKPYMQELFAKVKSKGKYTLLHCCGNVETIFPDMIEMGLDVYNTVQPELYDLKKIKKEYGKDLTFWGAISTQQLLPWASAQEVYDTSVETIRILGQGGGYLFSPTHALTPDIPAENIRAMLRAVKDTRWE